jgi:hypothetical protein
VPVGLELVVGRTGNDLMGQALNGSIVEYAAEGAGGEDGRPNAQSFSLK